MIDSTTNYTCPDWCAEAPHDFDTDIPWDIVDGVNEYGRHHFSDPVGNLGVHVGMLEFRCGGARRTSLAEVCIDLQPHEDGTTAERARQMAADLLAAADLVDRINAEKA